VIGESAAQRKELAEQDDYLSGICRDFAERVKAESEQRARRRRSCFLEHNSPIIAPYIQVNVQARSDCRRMLFGAKMVSRGSGGIINLASNAAFQRLPRMVTYAAAKR
jgi:hypothetical protein